MIKNIIFDVGDVLARPKTGHWFITPNFWNIIDKKFVDEINLKASLDKYSFLQTQKPKNEYEEYIMFSLYYYMVLKDINYPNITTDIASRLASDCVYNDEKLSFFSDYTILKELSEKYNLYIISDSWPSSFRILKNMKIDKCFKEIIISSMFSTKKEEELFDKFLDKYPNVVPEESIYIDDNLNILKKAKNYNFNLLLMDRYNKHNSNDFISISNLDNLLDTLKTN